MNRLIEFFARQGTFVNLLTFAVFVIGIGAIATIQREVFPNVDFDVVTVTTTWPGSSPDTMEKLITNPLESDINEVDGIKKLTSVSSEGISMIAMEVDPDQASADEVKEDVQDIIDGFNDLPDGANDPVAVKLESKITPTIEVVISSKLPEEEIRKAAKRMEKHLEKVRGVNNVVPNGMRDIEVKVESLPARLREYRVSLQDLIGALQRRNINMPGGTLESMNGGTYNEFIVRTIGEYDNLKDIEDTVIRANPMGEAIRVRDVAKVSYGFEKLKTDYRINGQKSISLTVLKNQKADTIKMVGRVKAAALAFQPKLGEDFSVDFVNDQSVFVQRRIRVLSNNMLAGLGLVLIVLSLILPLRIALITAVGIPFAFLATMALFQFNSYSINMISMMGLIIVVGMLVDDAVVVTENAQRLREEGNTPLQAAITGTHQVWAPVLVSVSTTIMAFAPLMFMTGVMGKFVRHIPIAVITALIFSLWECFFILPHHIGAWIKQSPKGEKPPKGLLGGLWDRYVLPRYISTLNLCLKLRYGVALLAFLLFVGSTVFAIKKMPFVLFPPGGIDMFLVNIEGPKGSSLAETTRLIGPVEGMVLALPESELDDVVTKIGEHKMNANDPKAKKGSHFAQLIVYLKPEADRDRTADEIIADLKEKSQGITTLKKVAFEKAQGGPPVGKPVAIGVQGNEYEKIRPAVADLEKLLAGIPGVSDIENNFVEGKDELRIKVDFNRAASAGLSMQDIGVAVRSAVDGIVATSIRKLDEEIDIRVSLGKDALNTPDALKKVLIPNRTGSLVPLDRVASLEPAKGIAAYQHTSAVRQILVTAEIDTDVNSSTGVTRIVQEKMDDLLAPHPDINLDFSGEFQDTQESLQSLLIAFAFAVGGIAFILILLFGNLYQPAVVMSTIPLGIIAVIWAFYINRMHLSFLALVGVVALAGVIVNNAIVFMDFVNQARREGQNRFDSIKTAAARRLRPIFLTTVTTVAGILPTAYGLGGDDSFVVPIAMALGWGILFGSVLTVIVLPSILAVVDDQVGLMRRLFRRKGEPREDLSGSRDSTSA